MSPSSLYPFTAQMYFIKETPERDYKVMWNIDTGTNVVIISTTETDPEDGRILDYTWSIETVNSIQQKDFMFEEMYKQGYTRIYK